MATAVERRRWIGWLTGTAISAALAMFLIYSVRGTPRSLLVPVVFIVFIILCARYFGLLAGIAGSVLSTGLFAIFLYEPYGSIAVKDHQAELNLVLLLFAGIALSYANASPDDENDPDSHS